MADFAAFSGKNGEPTELERKLIEHSAVGRDTETAWHEGDENAEAVQVSAELVAAIATGTFRHRRWPNWQFHPGGFQLTNATLRGRLDLRGRKVPSELALIACRLTHGFDFDNARFEGPLYLDRSVMRGECRMANAIIGSQFVANQATFKAPEGVALFAQCVKADGWFMDGARIEGVLNLNSAIFEGQFGARVVEGQRAEFVNPGGDAIFAGDVKANDWIMDGARIDGEFNLGGAVLAGRFSAEVAEGRRAEFVNPGGDAIFAGDVKANDWIMDGARIDGEFNLGGAVIAGHFSAMVAEGQRAEFINPGGNAIIAFNVRVSDWFMDGARVEGAFDFNSAVVARQFTASNVDGNSVEFLNPQGVAIFAANAEFGGSVFLDDGARIEGECTFAHATCRKDLRFSGAVLKASRHRALNLRNATIHGELLLDGAVVHGHIHANRARFHSRVGLRGGRFMAASVARKAGLLPEQPARSTDGRGNLELRDERRQDRTRHHALVFREARISGRLVMPDEFPEGIVDFSRASCDALEDRASGWPKPLARRFGDAADGRLRICEAQARCDLDGKPACDHDGKPIMDEVTHSIQHLVLDGFAYNHLEFPDGTEDGRDDAGKARANWLAGQGASDLKHHFNPQPWRQCALTLRQMGYDEAAQHVSIERRVRQRFSDGVSRGQRFVSWFLHQVADYGYNPWKAVRISAMLILLCAGAFSMGAAKCKGPEGLVSAAGNACGGQPAFLQTKWADFEERRPKGSSGAELTERPAYPGFHAVFFSLDTFVPLFDLGMENYWRANARAWYFDKRSGLQIPVGWMLYLLSVFELIFGSILIAIAITGFTGFLTRDDK